jgi:hypothetical protein
MKNNSLYNPHPAAAEVVFAGFSASPLIGPSFYKATGAKLDKKLRTMNW